MNVAQARNEVTKEKRVRCRVQDVAQIVYNHLVKIKEVGKYNTTTIHNEIGVDRYRFYDAMEYLVNKGYVKSLGRLKEEDGMFRHRFTIEKELPQSTTPIDINSLRGKNQQVEELTAKIVPQVEESIIDNTARVEQTQLDIPIINETVELLGYMSLLEKAVDRALDKADDLQTELQHCKQDLIAERRNRIVLKEKINSLTERINRLK